MDHVMHHPAAGNIVRIGLLATFDLTRAADACYTSNAQRRGRGGVLFWRKPVDPIAADGRDSIARSPKETTPAGPGMPAEPDIGAPSAPPSSDVIAVPMGMPMGFAGAGEAESPIEWRIIGRLGKRYLGAHRALAITYVVGSLVAVSILPVATTAMFGVLTRYFQPTQTLPLGSAELLLHAYWIWVVLVLAGVLLGFAYKYVSAYLAARVNTDLRADVFDSLLRQSPRYFHDHDANALTAIVNQWTAQVSTGLIQLLIDPVVQLVGVVIVGATLYQALLRLGSQNGSVTYELFAAIAAFALLSPILVVRLGRRLEQQTAAVQRTGLGMATLVGGALKSPEEIQALRAESYFAAKYRVLLAGDVRTRMAQTVVMERLNVISTMPSSVVLVLLIGFAVWLARGNPASATAYTVVTVGLLTPQLMGAVQGLSSFSISAQTTWPAMKMVADALAAHSDVIEAPGARDVERIAPTIEARHLTFSYEPGVLPDVLSDVSFALPEQKVTGLVARPGRGKTTLFRLLLRFYDPQQGELLVGGIPIRDFSVRSLRRHIALMTQESAFFHDSVRENFRIAGADLTDDAIEQMCRQTGLWAILTAHFGARPLDAAFTGELLSGGERKLFALTRLLLQQPSIVLFDEPTVGMGPLEKGPLVDVMRTACAGRTVISVDHDIVWLTRFCDYFLVLDGARIVQQGSADDLLREREGLFSQLYEEASRGAQPGSAATAPTAPPPGTPVDVPVALPA